MIVGLGYFFVFGLFISDGLVIYISFLVSAKKQTRYIKSSSESDESMPSVHDSYFEFRGDVRKEFAMEAALVDHARNMICSPLAVLMPLGKLALGADKTTENELLSAIGLGSRKQIKTAYRLLISNMEYLPGVTLDVASRIYISTKHDIKKKFMKRTKKIFKSSCRKIDRSDPSQTAKSINKWVAEKTRNKIRKIVSSSDISDTTSMILVNAIYFSGSWSTPFQSTRTGDFHSPSGVRKIPMMSHQGKYNYYKCDVLNAQVIEIPYEGDSSSMVIVLPFSNDGLPVLLRTLKLAPDLLNQALDSMQSSRVILTMPKFKIESEFDLTDLLKKIGLRTMFDPRKSGLTGMVDDETVYVSKAIHKAVIEVNERGTDAAAAAGVKLVPVSGYMNVPIFNANRPFLFYISFVQEQMFAGVFSG